MPANFFGRIAVCFAVVVLGCGGDEKPPEKEPEPEVVAPMFPKTPAPKAPRIGDPTGCEFLDGGIRIQMGAAEGLRSFISPSDGKQFMVLRMSVVGSPVFSPKDYVITTNPNLQPTISPIAVGFGKPNGVFASVQDNFVGEMVQLVPGESDQVLHDGFQIKKAELKNPSVYLVYELASSTVPKLWHGQECIGLSPQSGAVSGDIAGDGGTLTSQMQFNLTDPNATSDDYSAQLVNSSRTRISLNQTPTDVVIVTLELTATKSLKTEWNKKQMALQGAGGMMKGRAIYMHFDNAGVRPTAGSTFIEGESYEGKDLIGLEAGSMEIPLNPTVPTTATLIFTNANIQGDLDLKLSANVSVEVPEPVNPLGKFPPPIDKLPSMVAWAPLIGTPLDANYVNQAVNIAASSKQVGETKSTAAQDGLRYLLVKFRINQDAKFVPVDYRVAEQGEGEESLTIYRPVAVSFGSSPFVKGLDYEQIEIKQGPGTQPKHTGGRLTSWTVSSPEVSLLYEVAPSQEFIFIHGNTQFVIEL